VACTIFYISLDILVPRNPGLILSVICQGGIPSRDPDWSGWKKCQHAGDLENLYGNPKFSSPKVTWRMVFWYLGFCSLQNAMAPCGIFGI